MLIRKEARVQELGDGRREIASHPPSMERGSQRLGKEFLERRQENRGVIQAGCRPAESSGASVRERFVPDLPDAAATERKRSESLMPCASGNPALSPTAGSIAPACTRNLGGSISRKAAAHAKGPSGFGARGGRCGRCVESVLHVSSRWPQARGTKRFRQAANQKPETRNQLTGRWPIAALPPAPSRSPTLR